MGFRTILEKTFHRKSMVGTRCVVYKCQWENGAIYCEIRTSGVIVREERGRFVVDCNGDVQPYPKALVEIERAGQ